MRLLKKYDFRKYNFLLVLVIIVLASFGALMIYSASLENPLSNCIKQIFGIVVGVMVMIGVSLIDYNFILKFYWLIYIVNMGLLLSVAILGANYQGAVRWLEINLGPLSVSLQPSEFTKIFLILFMAKFLSIHRDKISSFRFLGILTLVVIPPVYMLYNQPDLSTTILIGIVLVTMVYCAGLKYKNIIIILLCAIPILVTGIIYIQSPDQKLLYNHQVNRIMAFIDPENYDDQRYQQDYAVKAIGSGQLYGKGYNNDDSDSVKNAGFIAESESDFIFAVIGEEFGFVGGCFLIFLLAFLVFECILIAIYAKDFHGRLIACGYGALIAFESFINIGVATEVLPNTGLPLPFVSMGLSSLIALFGGAGVVLNVGLQRIKKL